MKINFKTIFQMATGILLFLNHLQEADAMYLQINANGQVLNTNTLQNYDSLMQFISTSSDPEIKQYYKELGELNKFVKQGGGLYAQMIGPNIFIGSRLLNYQNYQSDDPFLVTMPGIPASSSESDHFATITKTFVHPNPSYDLAILVTSGFEDNFSHYSPIKRYHGSDLSSKDSYLVSFAIHNQNGQSLEKYLTALVRRRKARYKKGRFTGQSVPVINLNDVYNSSKIMSSFYTDKKSLFGSTFYEYGDYGAPVVIKVSNTGDVLEDYRYLGFARSGATFQALNTAHPDISNWIANISMAIALDNDNPNRVNPKNLLEKNDEKYLVNLNQSWFQLDLNGSSSQLGLYRRILPDSSINTRGSFFIDPSWVIGVTNEDFSNGQNVTIKHIRFPSKADYMQRHQKTRSYPVKKVFNLGKGRSIAILKRPVLEGVEDIEVLKNEDRVKRYNDLLKLKRLKTLWYQSSISSNQEWLQLCSDYRQIFFPNKGTDQITPDNLIQALENKIQEITALDNQIQNIIIRESLSAL